MHTLQLLNRFCDRHLGIHSLLSLELSPIPRVLEVDVHFAHVAVTPTFTIPL
jgi:hypothetical protein